MPGNNISLTLPSLSDTLTTIVSKVNTALTAIQTDIAPKVSASQINVNGQLDFQGNNAVNVGAVVLSNGANSTAGALFYLGGDFYAYTALGSVKLTSAGALNTTTVGAIGGDPSAVTYNASANEFRFQNPSLAYGALVGSSLKLSPASGGPLTLTVDSSLSGRTINVKSLPTAGVSMLAYDASTSSLVDGGSVPVTNAATFSSATISSGTVTVLGSTSGTITTLASTTATLGTLTTTTADKHTYSRSLMYYPTAMSVGGGMVLGTPLNYINNLGIIVCATSPGYIDATSPILGLRAGDRITGFTFYWGTKTAATVSGGLYKYSPVTGLSTLVQSFTDSTTGAHVFTQSVGSPVTAGGTDMFYFKTSNSTQFALNDTITGISISYDHP